MIKFYVTIVRNPGPRQKVARALGPYDAREEAEARVDDARRLAHQADPFTAFDAFGVSSWELPEGMKVWPPGKLNHLLAMAE